MSDDGEYDFESLFKLCIQFVACRTLVPSVQSIETKLWIMILVVQAILAQAKSNKLEGRPQLREAKLEELSLEIRDNLLIPSSLRLLS